MDEYHPVSTTNNRVNNLLRNNISSPHFSVKTILTVLKFFSVGNSQGISRHLDSSNCIFKMILLKKKLKYELGKVKNVLKNYLK